MDDLHLLRSPLFFPLFTPSLSLRSLRSLFPLPLSSRPSFSALILPGSRHSDVHDERGGGLAHFSTVRARLAAAENTGNLPNGNDSYPLDRDKDAISGRSSGRSVSISFFSACRRSVVPRFD